MQLILEWIGTHTFSCHCLQTRDQFEKSLMVLPGIEPWSCTLKDKRPNHYTTETIIIKITNWQPYWTFDIMSFLVKLEHTGIDKGKKNLDSGRDIPPLISGYYIFPTFKVMKNFFICMFLPTTYNKWHMFFLFFFRILPIYFFRMCCLI